MKFFIKLSLCLLCFALVSESFSAQKRYKKRHHKLQLSGNLSMNEDIELMNSHLSVNYARNFEMFEVGALFGVTPDDLKLKELFSADGLSDLGLMAGVLAEYNFIRNKRRNNMVPALGLKVILKQSREPVFFITPYLALKSFVSTRTSINLELEYPLKILEKTDFNFQYWQGINLLFGYAYYFH